MLVFLVLRPLLGWLVLVLGKNGDTAVVLLKKVMLLFFGNILTF